MITLANGFQIAAAVGGLLFAYVKLSQTERAEAKTLAYRGATILAAVGVGIVSVLQIVAFGMSDDPMTRRDVLWLLLHIWNAFVYAGCGIGLAAYWHGQKQKAKVDPGSQQPVAKP